MRCQKTGYAGIPGKPRVPHSELDLCSFFKPLFPLQINMLINAFDLKNVSPKWSRCSREKYHLVLLGEGGTSQSLSRPFPAISDQYPVPSVPEPVLPTGPQVCFGIFISQVLPKLTVPARLQSSFALTLFRCFTV